MVLLSLMVFISVMLFSLYVWIYFGVCLNCLVKVWVKLLCEV